MPSNSQINGNTTPLPPTHKKYKLKQLSLNTFSNAAVYHIRLFDQTFYALQLRINLLLSVDQCQANREQNVRG